MLARVDLGGTGGGGDDRSPEGPEAQLFLPSPHLRFKDACGPVPHLVLVSAGQTAVGEQRDSGNARSPSTKRGGMEKGTVEERGQGRARERAQLVYSAGHASVGTGVGSPAPVPKKGGSQRDGSIQSG